MAQKIYQTGKGKVKLAQNRQIIYAERGLRITNFVADLDSDNENSII